MGSAVGKFFEACEQGKISTVEKYVYHRESNINKTDEDGKTGLYISSKWGHYDIIDFLLRNGAKVDQPANNGITPFMAACNKGHLKIVKRLAKAEANVNKLDDRNRNAMYYAAVNDHAEVVEELLKHKCRFDIKNDSGESALEVAIKLESIKTLRVLLPQTPKEWNLDGKFTEACKKGYTSVVKCLLEHGCKKKDKDLMIASENGFASTLKVLMHFEISEDQLEDKESRWQRPLHFASEHGHHETVALLLKRGADPNCQDKGGDTPLHLASKGDFLNCVTKLTKAGASPNKHNDNGLTPYAVACIYQRTDIIEHLIHQGADVNIKNQYGASLLCSVCTWQMDENDTENFIIPFLTKLVRYKSDVNLPDEKGRTPLWYACFKGNIQVIHFLLGHDAEVNQKDADGMSPFFIAAEKGHINVMKILFRNEADVDAPDKNGCTPLWIASERGNEEAVDFLLAKKSSVDHANIVSQTPLYAATKNGNHSIVVKLLVKGADPNLCDDVQTSPIFIASQSNDVAILESLLTYDADVNTPDKWGVTPVSIASTNGHKEALFILLAHKADPNITDIQKRSPLYRSAQAGHDATIDTLLSNGADPNLPNSEGLTPLHLCTINGFFHSVEKLLSHGAKVAVKDSVGFTSLFYACLDPTDTSILEILLARGDASSFINEMSYEGETALHFACSQNNFRATLILLNKSADVNLVNGEGDTPLIIACKINNTGLITLLVEHGCNVNQIDSNGQTAIHHVCKKNNVQALRLLLGKGYPHIKDKDGNQAIHVACKEGHIDCIQVLHEHNFDIESLNGSGNGPIHLAIEGQNVDLINMLLTCGANIQRANHKGDTPLHIAVQRCKGLSAATYHVHAAPDGKSAGLTPKQKTLAKIIKIFIGKGADINAHTMHGKTCLHIAAQDDSISVLYFLIKLKAEVDATDIFKQTPLHVAAHCGNNKVIQGLLGKNASLLMRDATGKLPIHHAAKHLQSFNLLLKEMQDKGLEISSDDWVKCGDLLHWFGHRESLIEKIPPSLVDFEGEHSDRPQHLTEENCEDIYHIPTALEWAKDEQKKRDKAALITHCELLLKKFSNANNEWESITSVINGFVADILQLIAEKNPELASTPMMTGSSQEKTQVLEPNKLMFINILNVSGPYSAVGINENPGTVMLRTYEKDDIPNSHQTLLSSMKNNAVFLNAHTLSSIFKAALCKALQNEDIWTKYPSLSHESIFDVLSGAQSADHLEVVYHGKDFPMLPITIQIYPGILLTPDKLPKTLLSNPHVQRDGAIAIAQYLPSTHKQKDKFTLRFTLSESEIFSTIPKEVSDAFRLAKIMRHHSICPRIAAIEIDFYITTYILKNCLLTALDKDKSLENNNNKLDDCEHMEKVLVWARKIYENLELSLENGCLNSFFLENNLLLDERYTKPEYKKQALAYASIIKTLLTPYTD